MNNYKETYKPKNDKKDLIILSLILLPMLIYIAYYFLYTIFK